MTKKVIIIGAGPTGLYFASLCEEKGINYLILEGSNQVGGQISHLYPEKEVVDLPNIESIKAIDYIRLLEKKVNPQNIIFEARVENIKSGEIIEISTAKSTYFAENVVIAAGLGASVPRPLGVEHENEVSNIIYSLHDFSHLKDKKVAIFGGGDSALDWAKEISAISDHVHLIHRRLEFRGNPETIKDCKNLAVHLPFVPGSIEVKDGKAISVTINKVDEEGKTLTIPVDYIFVNYGNVAKQSDFPFEKEGLFIKVNENCQIEKNIYAIGDICAYENKTRRMAPGILEANKVIKLI